MAEYEAPKKPGFDMSAMQAGIQNMVNRSIQDQIEDQKVEMKVLTPDQIEQAQILLKRRHPLHKIPIWRALPILKPLRHLLPSWLPRVEDPYEERSKTIDKLTPVEKKKATDDALKDQAALALLGFDEQALGEAEIERRKS